VAVVVVGAAVVYVVAVPLAVLGAVERRGGLRA
jgi:hypothetical protein